MCCFLKKSFTNYIHKILKTLKKNWKPCLVICCYSNNILFDSSVLKMKVQLFLNFPYWPEETSSSFFFHLHFKLTVSALYVWLWNCVYVMKETNFNRNKSTIFKNQKQSEINEANYIKLVAYSHREVLF